VVGYRVTAVSRTTAARAPARCNSKISAGSGVESAVVPPAFARMPTTAVDQQQECVKATAVQAFIQNNFRNLRKSSEFSVMIRARSAASNNANVTILLVGRLLRPV
jgi:hypothetical protein